MQSSGHTSAPEPTGGFRARFSRRPEEPRLLPSEMRLIDLLQRAVDERLEDGLLAIEEQARDLMREIAAEMWRTSSSDLRPEQERIVSLLSRDQALKSLITTGDERFQALAVRASRLEDSLRELADGVRASREDMAEAIAAIRELVTSPTVHGVERIRAQLEQVEEHIAATMQHLDERDRTLTEAVLQQVRDHGELVARETARVVEAMQGYVQGGTEAMGRLASRVEDHAETFAGGTAAVDGVRQQLEMLDERLGINGRSMHEIQRGVERLIEARVLGLAQLIRADSEALRSVIDERVLAGQEFTAEVLERRTGEVRADLERQGMEVRGELERTSEEVRGDLARRTEAMAAATSEQLSAINSAIAATIERSLERIAEQMGSFDGMERLIEVSERTEERLKSHVDDRVAAIAKLVRADNQVLAERLGAGGDADQLRTVVRSVKELEAGLAAEVTGSVDRRFQQLSDQLHHESQSTTEAMLKIAEALSDRIERLTVRVDEGVGSDLQIVIDRMGDAIQAMSARSGRQSA
jgi:HPt (histidine-containing phosphotransfer) domain-containing protein